MGSSEEIKPLKPEKQSSPPQDQTNVHVYPDWAAMQAYYGPRVAVSPYFNSSIAPGHTSHPYVWGPLQITCNLKVFDHAACDATIWGALCSNLCTWRCLCTSWSSSLDMDGFSILFSLTTQAGTPNVETPTKSSGHTDKGLMKRLKGFDGLAMSIGNGNADSANGGANHVHSQSEETETSSDGSNGNTGRGNQNGRKRSCEEKPTIAGESNGALGKVGVPPSSVSGNSAGPIVALELRNPSSAKESPASTPVTPQPCSMVPNDAWLQVQCAYDPPLSFQSERELKREKRKQSNRESARRSRLRKQAEAEELGRRVESLSAENTTLKSEINRLTQNSEKLKLENAILMDKLKIAQGGRIGETDLTSVDDKRVPISTENLLSRVNNSGSVDRSDEGDEQYVKNSDSKLRQLLDANPRSDVVAAS
ncbi:common plant regulatory factor 1-like isoform X2 [Diospyros lotus]|uniref:common plant regulatory factor 1-like isoform X2 n=1 Tax=Diospyros lotus TaxID=55363 RepID=UPI0022534638|nr:common plant regulatory factor 1-like isoform X2 [Diospyros lotus]